MGENLNIWPNVGKQVEKLAQLFHVPRKANKYYKEFERKSVCKENQNPAKHISMQPRAMLSSCYHYVKGDSEVCAWAPASFILYKLRLSISLAWEYTDDQWLIVQTNFSWPL